MIKVDKDICMACGACIAIDEEHFGFDDQGLSEVIKDEVTESVKQAADACPVGAIEVTEETEA